MKPLLDLDFRTTYVEGGVLYTPATMGSRAVIERAVMGTGVPGNANAPAITPIGASFDGGDYVNTESTTLLGYNVPWSIAVRVRPPFAGVNAIISNYSGASARAHFRVYSWIGFEMTDAGGGSIIIEAPRASFYNAPHTITVIYDGTSTRNGLSLYVNGAVPAGISRSGAGITGTTSTNAPFWIGRAPAPADGLVASIRRIQVFPFCMTPAQVRAIHERFEREGES